MKKLFKKLLRKYKKIFIFSKEEYDLVLDFFLNYQGFRTLYDCSMQTKLDIEKCKEYKKRLYKERKLGMYYFKEGADPQPFMFEYIKKTIPNFSYASHIAEVGPGKFPIISDKKYSNWVGIDYNFQDNVMYGGGGVIDFNGRIFEIDNYPTKNIHQGSWESLLEIPAMQDRLNTFDFVMGSHSYEHVFEPIKSLDNAAKLLKPNGYLILFVPDGFSDEPASREEPTHTLFLVPDMIKEFFRYCGKYKNLKIEVFRPNYDYVITAQKA
ncbi:class I SAM-dependent methyltransferase [Helicobacter turcicus]|uniref:Class I SAM-dependent methyltransferase n=1 Tax=Helicobacter turcicus TaxID=2867412 RepID=A0ABS7JM21_9HELI|nr:methyltransferase domain-containing protein [Helicobacter turcicus]MBX7490433.1 class I SAM-dependent methyltransferase [Helicobacter turcicus]MBX7545294.1 class I SAM-dependent methyltransferase [Helicobacter turcicus]